MDVTITTIYCLCDDFLKAMNHHPDDPQARLSTAEVTPPSRHWLFVLSLIVLTAMVSACAGSNEPNRSSSSADAIAGGDTTSPSSTGAGIGSNLLWAVAYGSKGLIVVGNSGVIASSTDGKTWQRVPAPTVETLRGATTDGETYVTVGTGGTIVSSEDTRTWTKHETKTNQMLSGAAFGGDAWVVVGESGTILHSTDFE